MNVTLRSFFKTGFKLALTSLLLSQPSPGQDAPADGVAPREETLRDKSSELVFLLVDKTRLTAELLTWPELGQKSEKLISFRIAIGKENGDKQKSGDNKTPEGIYFAKSIINGRGLPAKYGPFAIPIDFPNPLDRFLGKTGYGIWLHGVEQDSRIEAANVTEGCVAFYNADIRSLTQWLSPMQSIIVIAKDATQVNRVEDVEQVTQLVHDWTNAWNDRDVDRYISYFIPDFRSVNNQNLRAYKAYKARVFASYRSMSVTMKDVRVFTHDRYAVAVMNQDFAGDERFHAKGRKVLYWQRLDKGGWKLFHEEFDPQPVKFTNLSRDKIAQIIKTSPSTKYIQDSRESKL
jgi:murein L,D-transpeptidase YafK